jgi:hypothetical protein
MMLSGPRVPGLAAAIFAASLVAGCGPVALDARSGPQDFSVGERFEYVFTASGWSADKSISRLDRTIVQQVGAYRDEPADDCNDCAATVHWVFEAVSPGTTTLEVSESEWSNSEEAMVDNVVASIRIHVK